MTGEFKETSPCVQSPLPIQPYQIWRLRDDKHWLEFYRCKNRFLLRFPELADFWVSKDGSETTCVPAVGIAESTVQHLFLNQVRPLALSLRGVLSFHASVVDIGDMGVAFFGASGRGKSTLATSFATNGHPFIADDCLTLEPALDKRYRVIPGHPSLRLWNDSRNVLMTENAVPILEVSYTSKSRFVAEDGIMHSGNPVTLRAAYFLGEGTSEDVVIRPLSGAGYMILLVRHSFQLDVEDPAHIGRSFEAIGDLCLAVPGFSLDYPRSFTGLNALRAAVITHSKINGVSDVSRTEF